MAKYCYELITISRRCGIYLLSCYDEIVDYNIFEEFDIGVTSFFHDDNLMRLKNAGFINDLVMSQSSKLRNLVTSLRESDKWNIETFKHSQEWRKIIDFRTPLKKTYPKNKTR